MTPEEKLRHWEETFRGMRLYPFMIHDPYAVLQVADPGDERLLAQSIWHLGEKLKVYALEMLEEAGALKEAIAGAAGQGPIPTAAPEFTQPAPPPMPRAQLPPAARRGRTIAGPLPPGTVEVAGEGPSFSFLQPGDPARAKQRSIA